MPVLEIRGITKAFKQRIVVQNVSFSVNGGERFALLGPSGSGKTTILRTIAGLERPGSGAVVLCNMDVTSTPPADRNVTLVFQDLALWPHMSVRHHVEFVLRPRLRSRSAREDRVLEVLALVGLAGRERAYPHELSGGEQQRLALARAIAWPRKLVLLDEPWANLDPYLRCELRAEVSRIAADLHLTLLQATHDHAEALATADRIAILHDGRLEQIGHPNEVLRNPATPFVKQFLDGTQLVTRRFT